MSARRILDITNLRVIDRKQGGTFTPLHIAEAQLLYNDDTICRKKVVIKQYGAAPDFKDDCQSFLHDDLNLLLPDLFEIRESVQKHHVPIPELFCLSLIQENMGYGEAIRTLVDKKRWVLCNDPLTNEIEQLLNIAFSDYAHNSLLRLIMIEEYAGDSLRNKISVHAPECSLLLEMAREIISTMPENVWLDCNPANFVVVGETLRFVDFMPPKISEYQGLGRMESIFPTIKKLPHLDEERRRRQYLKFEGRIERFNYYVAKFSQSST